MDWFPSNTVSFNSSMLLDSAGTGRSLHTSRRKSLPNDQEVTFPELEATFVELDGIVKQFGTDPGWGGGDQARWSSISGFPEQVGHPSCTALHFGQQSLSDNLHMNFAASKELSERYRLLVCKHQSVDLAQRQQEALGRIPGDDDTPCRSISTQEQRQTRPSAVCARSASMQVTPLLCGSPPTPCSRSSALTCPSCWASMGPAAPSTCAPNSPAAWRFGLL